MDETDSANEDANGNTHPPRSKEANNTRTNAAGQRGVEKAKLPELELGVILW